jgi:hypothetical protein
MVGMRVYFNYHADLITMGLDIYCFVELQDESGQWRFHEEIEDTNPDHAMTAHIAGIRGPGDGFAKKGFPDDVTAETMRHYGGLDVLDNPGFYGACWIDASEVAWVASYYGGNFRKGMWQNPLDNPTDYPWAKSIRWVVWFG